MRILILLLLGLSCYGQAPTLPVPRFLTDDPKAKDYWHCFSADGSRIIFSRSYDGQRNELQVVPVHGGAVVPFLKKPFELEATRPSTSISGQIVFTATDTKGKASVWTVGKDGNDPQQVITHNMPGNPLYPSWYPHEKQLLVVAYQGNSGGVLVKVDLNTGNTAVLPDLTSLRCGMPSVSPDGKAVVFAGQKKVTGEQTYNQKLNSIWLWQDDKQPVQLDTCQGRAPSWSPDGRWVAFESTSGGANGLYAIFIISREGKNLQRITDYQWNANHPVWSPDGNTISISAVHPGQGNRTSIALIENVKALLRL